MKPADKAQLDALVADDPVDGLVTVMRHLRDPDTGCPWDLQQTFATIIPHTIEETYEVAEAILHGDPAHVCEELGDLLFQVVFYAQLGAEQGWFTFPEIAQGMCHKLIRRHPHVFSEQTALSPADVKAQWAAIKAQEKAEKPRQDTMDGVLCGIPEGMTPLLKACKIQKACAKVGFDWPEVSAVYAKIQEELDEVADAATHAASDAEHAAVVEEVGDLLFAVVNLARHLNVDPETALIRANHKFTQRFNALEQQAMAMTDDLSTLSLETLDGLWNDVKRKEAKH